jgi:hypothetical protein
METCYGAGPMPSRGVPLADLRGPSTCNLRNGAVEGTAMLHCTNLNATYMKEVR